MTDTSDNVVRASNPCNCPNGSYGKKHTAECYEARIERLQARVKWLQEWKDACEETVQRERRERAAPETNPPWIADHLRSVLKSIDPSRLHTACRLIKQGPPADLPNDEVAGWAAAIAQSALEGVPVETSDAQALLTVQQENKRLRGALATISCGTPDLMPPYRAMEATQLREIASTALRGAPALETNVSETDALEARRYRVLRACIEPRTLYDKLTRYGMLKSNWRDLTREQTIYEKIAELCDASKEWESIMAKGREPRLDPNRQWESDLEDKHAPKASELPMTLLDRISILDRKVPVCDSCLCACCWQGDFYCNDAKGAGTVDKTIRELYQINADGVREDSGYWFKDPNTGKVDYDAKSAAKRAWNALNGEELS